MALKQHKKLDYLNELRHCSLAIRKKYAGPFTGDLPEQNEVTNQKLPTRDRFLKDSSLKNSF